MSNVDEREIIIPENLIDRYFSSLVNKFFKILPLKESDDSGLVVYIRSLQREITGCHDLLTVCEYDSAIMSLLCILQYHIDHSDCDVQDVRRDVFKAISICNRLKDSYRLKMEVSS